MAYRLYLKKVGSTLTKSEIYSGTCTLAMKREWKRSTEDYNANPQIIKPLDDYIDNLLRCIAVANQLNQIKSVFASPYSSPYVYTLKPQSSFFFSPVQTRGAIKSVSVSVWMCC